MKGGIKTKKKHLLFYFIFIVFFVLYNAILFTSCKKSTEPLTNSAELVIDFQKGFWGEKYIIFFDNDTIFYNYILTDPYYDFALRMPLSCQNGKHKLKVLDEDYNNFVDTTIFIKDSTFLGINYNRFLNTFSLDYNNMLPNYNYIHPNDINALQIKFNKGIIGVFRRPFWPPDPISCYFSLEILNKNNFIKIENLNIPTAGVYLDSSNQFLGNIRLTTESDTLCKNIFYPGKIDFLCLLKIQEDSTIFEPPFKDYVYLNFDIFDKYNNIRSFKTDLMLFDLVW